jgi:hypothetical protein
MLVDPSHLPLFSDPYCGIQRYLLPLLTHSYQARISLRAHQKELLSKLITSTKSLKETQLTTFSVLPKPQPFQEDPKYKHCHTLGAVINASGQHLQKIPPFTILRCAIEEVVSQGRDSDTEALFRTIDAILPPMSSEDRYRYQVS